MESSARTWIAALRGSQQRLAGLVGTLSPEQLRGPSYDPGWSIAQVLSHIGSQADIAYQSLAGTLAGREPAGIAVPAPARPPGGPRAVRAGGVRVHPGG